MKAQGRTAELVEQQRPDRAPQHPRRFVEGAREEALSGCDPREPGSPLACLPQQHEHASAGGQARQQTLDLVLVELGCQQQRSLVDLQGEQAPAGEHVTGGRGQPRAGSVRARATSGEES